jgi:uncharacterized protein YukE
VILTADGDVETAIDKNGILYLEDFELKAVRSGGETRIVTEKEEGFVEPPIVDKAGISSTAKAVYEIEIEELKKQIEEFKSDGDKELQAKNKEMEKELTSRLGEAKVKYEEEIKILNKEKAEMVKAMAKLENELKKKK